MDMLFVCWFHHINIRFVCVICLKDYLFSLFFIRSFIRMLYQIITCTVYFAVEYPPDHINIIWLFSLILHFECDVFLYLLLCLHKMCHRKNHNGSAWNHDSAECEQSMFILNDRGQSQKIEPFERSDIQLFFVYRSATDLIWNIFW